MTSKIEKLEKLLSESSPKPWKSNYDGTHIAFRPNQNESLGYYHYAKIHGWTHEISTNAELICALRNSASALLDIVRKAQYFKESEQLRDAYKNFEEIEL